MKRLRTQRDPLLTLCQPWGNIDDVIIGNPQGVKHRFAFHDMLRTGRKRTAFRNLFLYRAKFD